MLQHMTQERSRLMTEIKSLETQNDTLKQQVNTLQSKQMSNFELAQSFSNEDKVRLENAETMVTLLRKEVEETKHYLEVKVSVVLPLILFIIILFSDQLDK
jgi:vacuolar-type H+-ATPase subunit D/Vma8